MADADQFSRRARSELTLGEGKDSADLRLWDHSSRVARCAQMLAQLPEVGKQRVDVKVLRVAALYHDAGWAIQVRDGQVPRERIRTRPTSDIQLELAAGLIESSLKGVLPARTVAKSAEAVRGINDRGCRLVEAHIVSDADNLDQIGPVGLLQAVRRDVLEGRMISRVLDTWHRQQEYHYWEARIRDGIRFESVRELAWQRLAAVDPFMQALSEQIDAHDIAALLGIPAEDLPERTGVSGSGH